MRIRPFSPEYSAEIRSFVIGVLADEGFDYDPQKDFDLEDVEGNYIGSGGAFFMSVEDDRIVGTSAVRNLGSGVCEIKRLYVKNEFRGKGMGLALFRAALDFAQKHYSKAKLKTDSSLSKAISIYLGHGFTVLKEEDGTLFFEKPL